MVKEEKFTVRATKNGIKLPRGVHGMLTQFLPEVLERRSNGAWYVQARVKAVFEFEDGRTVRAEHIIRLRGAQEGKRPSPSLFGRKPSKK